MRATASVIPAGSGPFLHREAKSFPRFARDIAQNIAREHSSCAVLLRGVMFDEAGRGLALSYVEDHPSLTLKTFNDLAFEIKLAVFLIDADDVHDFYEDLMALGDYEAMFYNSLGHVDYDFML